MSVDFGGLNKHPFLWAGLMGEPTWGFFSCRACSWVHVTLSFVPCCARPSKKGEGFNTWACVFEGSPFLAGLTGGHKGTINFEVPWSNTCMGIRYVCIGCEQDLDPLHMAASSQPCKPKARSSCNRVKLLGVV